MKDVEDSRQLAGKKKKDKEAKQLAKKKNRTIVTFFRHPKILFVYGPNPSGSLKNTKIPGSSARNKKRGDSILIKAFRDLLQVEPDLFKDLVLDDLVSYTPAQNKGNGVPRRKNTTGLIQAVLELLGEERGGGVSEICISSLVVSIRNTCKM